MANPFLENVVRDPWQQTTLDIATINADAFDLFREALASLGQQGMGGTSLLLHGEAGSGKTHLLTRIRRFLQERQQMHLFVAVRLQTSPGGFWRYLRRCFADNLLRESAGGRTQLERMFLQRLRQLSDQRKIDAAALEALTEKLGVNACLSPDLCRVLVHLLSRRFVLDARAWLSGHSLAEQSLRQMGLATTEEARDPEEQARDFVLEICRLAGSYIPVVLCFDQIEALQQAPGDTLGLFRFGQVAGLLHDCTTNVLIVSCIQTMFIDTLRQAVVASDYDRLAARRGTLNPLTFEQALSLAGARLKSSREPAAVQQHCLDRISQDLQQVYHAADGQDMTARRVLARCATVFDAAGGAVETTVVDPLVFLDEQRARRMEAALAAMGPDDLEAVFLGALPPLLHMIDADWRERPERRTADIDLVFHGRGLDLGISLCNQRNMTSLAARFKRLLTQREIAGLDRLLLVRHPQRPISSGARKARAYLDELRHRGDALLHPGTEVLATIKTLGDLLAASQAGDLSYVGRTLSEATVRGWLQRALGGMTRDFLEQMLDTHASAKEADDGRLADLLAALDSSKVVGLQELAARLNWPADALLTLAQRHPSQVGVLARSPQVLFQRIAGSVNAP
jgi:hypothetical protein